MEPKRYWWMVIENQGIKWDGVTDVHPFTYMHITYYDKSAVTLLNYHSISVEEYNLYTELNNKA